jgi:hypothetical protein
MLSGIQEILVIVVILLAILFIPRMMSQKRHQAPESFRPMRKIRGLGVRWRLGIVASILWLLGAAAYCRPWQGAVERYVLYGAGPVVIGWSLTWVLAGFRSARKKN